MTFAYAQIIRFEPSALTKLKSTRGEVMEVPNRKCSNVEWLILCLFVLRYSKPWYSPLVLPILVICYVRLDTLRMTMGSIFAQAHGDVFVACDGAREENMQEALEVQQYVRSLKKDGLIREFRISEKPRGLLLGVSDGIDWFFDNVEIGIIIEDDLVLEPQILRTVEHTKKFLTNEKIVSIGLANLIPSQYLTDPKSLIRTSRFVVSWGWVTTRAAWKNRIRSYKDIDQLNLLWVMIKRIGLSSALFHFQLFLEERKLEALNSFRCTWDYLWQFNAFLTDSYIISYNRNMITNIGTGFGATHHRGKILDYPIQSILPGEMEELEVLSEIPILDKAADDFFCRSRKVNKMLRSKLKIRTRLRSCFRYFDNSRKLLS